MTSIMYVFLATSDGDFCEKGEGTIRDATMPR